MRAGIPIARKKGLTANALVKTYRQEVDRQNLMLKKAKLCEARLVFIVSALAELLTDENFVNLLRAEAIDSMPKYLSDQIQAKNQAATYDPVD